MTIVFDHFLFHFLLKNFIDRFAIVRATVDFEIGKGFGEELEHDRDFFLCGFVLRACFFDRLKSFEALDVVGRDLGAIKNDGRSLVMWPVAGSRESLL
jgi:hypothetical protein